MLMVHALPHSAWMLHVKLRHSGLVSNTMDT